MSNEVTTIETTQTAVAKVSQPNFTTTTAVETALVRGDISQLSTEDRIVLYNKTCESLGMNPLTKPFGYVEINGALHLYALKNATDQLRKLYKVNVRVTETKSIGDVYVVRVEVSDATGRVDTDIGAVPIKNLQGANLANALMKAETKAKRRATLSFCSLGMLDESEIETINNARIIQFNEPKDEPKPVIECKPTEYTSQRYEVSGAFKEKALSLGLDEKDLAKFCKENNIKGKDQVPKMKEFLENEQLLKEAINKLKETK